MVVWHDATLRTLIDYYPPTNSGDLHSHNFTRLSAKTLHIPAPKGGYDLKAVDMTRGNIAHYDCVVIITDHKSFDYAALLAEADLIVDTRNAIKQPDAKVFKLGAPRASGTAESRNIATIA